MISLTLVAGEINYYQDGMRRFHGFEMFRQRGSIECSNNVHIPKQQTPSKQALWEVGCVEKLTNIINSNIFYILGGIAAVAFMEIFGMLCSLCLCCAVKRIEDMKA